MLRSGARIINGTDAPVEDVDPVKSFYASVTRQSEQGDPPGGFEPDQRMSRAEALRSYTLDAAYGAFREKESGFYSQRPASAATSRSSRAPLMTESSGA